MSAVFIRKGGEFGHQYTEGKDRDGELGVLLQVKGY